MVGFPGGSSKRRIAHYGESVTFENDVIDTDESSDWNDASVATTTHSTTAVVQKQRTGTIARTQEGDEVSVDAAVYVHEDDLDGFEIRDGAEGGPTTVDVDGTVFVVLVDDVRPNGIHEIEVSRV